MSRSNSNCTIFAGPSLNGLAPLKSKGIRVLPPIRRGDVEKLIARRRPGTMAIVDGVFQQCLSVGHAEIRSALANGWQVWGLSSMGAIRAYEMRHMGMRGYGRVYQFFTRYVDFRDDEVALLHEATPPYRPMSEPLVHIRVWFKELRRMGLLNRREEKTLLESLMSTWFGERTVARARSAVLGLIPDQVAKVDETLREFDRYRVKNQDIKRFLEERPWQ